MTKPSISKITQNQRCFFTSGETLSYSFRVMQLEKLKYLIQKHQSEITEALFKDLYKPKEESMLHEIMLILKEINYILKNLKKWMKPTKVATPIYLWPGKSKIYYEPLGTTLIIGPWNYPFFLIFSPLIGAICAGNCAILKPSEIAVHTQNLIVHLINDYFPSHYLHVITGGPDTVSQLLEEPFDHLFFTGGKEVGKKILKAAAEKLTPVTLELGGKSPCILDETTNYAYAARRIIWAKMINAGQVCIAPDYIYVPKNRKAELINTLKKVLIQFYGEHPENSHSYGRIINKKHFDRLVAFLQKGHILHGGHHDAALLYIAPTLIDEVTWHDPIMQEEIFGPLLPILTYEHIHEVIVDIQTHDKPLALYLFTNNSDVEKTILQKISFGGGCINDSLLHIANPSLPFGGIGQSGFGSYH